MPSTDQRILRDLIRHMALDEACPLVPLIDSYFIERVTAPKRVEQHVLDLYERPRPPGRLSPSAIAGCQRQAVFKFVGIKGRKRVDPDFELLMEEGKWHHHKWQARFADMELVLGKDRFQLLSIEEEVRIPDLYIAGSLDALIKIFKKRYVVDFKSINTFGFNYIYQNHKPKDEHVKQIITYCVARGIKRGILLYDHKDSKEYKAYNISFSDEDWAEVERWCQNVIRKIRREQLPAKHPDCRHGSFLFDKCPFAPYCFSDKYTDEKLRKMAFKGFIGIDEAWEKSIKGA